MSLDLFFFRITQYLKYLFRAVGPHSLHSPFLFNLYHEVIKPAKKFRFKEAEQLRKKLRRSTELIETVDFRSGNTNLKTIGQIAKSSLSTPKFSSFIYLLNKFMESDSSLETGTSLGLNAYYLSKSCHHVSTIEGSSSITALAQKNLKTLDCKNIRLINGDLYQELESAIVRTKPDFYFLDADHRSSAVAFCIDLILRHTPETKCIVLHDIYWSRDMTEIWNSLLKDPRFTLSIDIFQAGLLFPSLSMEKQHFSIRF